MRGRAPLRLRRTRPAREPDPPFRRRRPESPRSGSRAQRRWPVEWRTRRGGGRSAASRTRGDGLRSDRRVARHRTPGSRCQARAGRTEWSGGPPAPQSRIRRCRTRARRWSRGRSPPRTVRERPTAQRDRSRMSARVDLRRARCRGTGSWWFRPRERTSARPWRRRAWR